MGRRKPAELTAQTPSLAAGGRQELFRALFLQETQENVPRYLPEQGRPWPWV